MFPATSGLVKLLNWIIISRMGLPLASVKYVLLFNVPWHSLMRTVFFVWPNCVLHYLALVFIFERSQVQIPAHIPPIMIVFLSPSKLTTNFLFYFIFNVLLPNHGGTQWRSGWGTALQTGRSRVRFPMASMDFFIDIILPVALWLWGRLNL
jgi:hypothetical protein